MSGNSMTELRTSLIKHKSALPPRVTLHEKLTVLFMFISLLLFFFRWNKFMDMGWASFRAEKSSPNIPGIKDASVAGIMVILLHVIPKSYNFLAYATADKKSELPPLKPESAVLWWKFVDKNTNYGYIFLIGSGIALVRSVRDIGLGSIISENMGKKFSDHSWNVSLLLVCLIAIILANMMTGVAACVTFLPFVLNLPLVPKAPPATTAKFRADDFLDMPIFRSTADTWNFKLYLGALGVGIGTTLGLMFPFKYTPAYFCNKTGKVPMKKMALYSFFSAWICLFVLWISLVYYAPFLWDPDDKGIIPANAPVQAVEGATSTTAAAAAGGGGAAAAAPPAGDAAPDKATTKAKGGAEGARASGD